MARVKSQVFKSMQGLLSKIRACMQFFRKRAEKYKIFKNLSKNVKRAGDCVRSSYTISC